MIAELKRINNGKITVFCDVDKAANVIIPSVMEAEKTTMCAMISETNCSLAYANPVLSGSGGKNNIELTTVTATIYLFTFPQNSDIGDVRAIERDRLTHILIDQVLYRIAQSAQITYPPSLFDDEEVGVQAAAMLSPEIVCDDPIRLMFVFLMVIDTFVSLNTNKAEG